MIVHKGAETATTNAESSFFPPANQTIRNPTVTQLTSRCWCERREVVIPQADVRNGITTSCGSSRCHPPASKGAA